MWRSWRHRRQWRQRINGENISGVINGGINEAKAAKMAAKS